MVDEAKKEENLSQEVDELLEQGLNQRDIEARGYSPSLVRQRIRKRVKAGKGLPVSSGRDTALTKKQQESVLPEWVAGQIDLFDGSERDKKIFVSGMSVPMLGLRLFSEAMAPFGELLKLWSLGQTEAARAAQGSGAEIAAQASRETLAGAMPQIMGAMKEFAVAGSPNPMMSMFAQTMQPLLGQVMGNMMTMFQPKPGQPGVQPPPGQPGAQPAPTPQLAFQQPAGQQATEDEVEEAFG